MGHPPKKAKVVKPSTKDKLKSIKKARKQKLKEKRARLIVRNLPFTADEENLRKHFEAFGEVEEVKMLKKEDGKLVGCAFVQFKQVQKAAKARFHTNEKPFLDRDILVDFALAKNKFEEIKVKKEKLDEVEIKQEPQEVPEMEEVKDGANIEESELKSDADEESEVKSSDDEDESEVKSSDDEGESEARSESGQDRPRPKVESHDVSEGRTVFIKNVPFTATNEDLKERMSQFGPLYYALVCMDKYTEHSKGTAFVKFRNKEDAEKALAAGTELSIFGQTLDCHPALDRADLSAKTRQKHAEKSHPKDSRNLYLVKEGVILAGSKAAEGVSATDMAKRLQLEQYKTQMLRNLNMFVSRDRLVVHNLPAHWDDKKLRALVQKNSPKAAVIREARVMRDLRNVDAQGVGRSKEFGFVTFSNHEDALYALRVLNNNPDIFSEHRRPIVAFSIENRAMVKAKMKRLEKSKLRNPKFANYDPGPVKADAAAPTKVVDVASDYAGTAAKPGAMKMRSRHNLKTQAKLHLERLKKEKKKRKNAKKTLKEKREEFTKQPKQKTGQKKKNKAGGDNFAKLVTDYKKMLQGPQTKKSKWFEEG